MNPFDKFEQFCANLRIDSKEQGMVPLRLNGCQRYYIKRARKAFAEGKRKLIILKGRQQGITTVGLAQDLYWSFKFPGTQGCVAADTDGNRDFFRATLTTYMEGLPRTHKVKEKVHNRNHLIFTNRSNLQYIVAGTRANGNLGRGKALNYLHATEVSSWADEEGLASLQSTLAQNHKDRLYLYESTARGFNLFFDMWNDAKLSVTQEAIFIPWYLKEDYCVSPGDPRYDTYWDGEVSSEEREWITEVKERYEMELKPGQIAWWRWMLYEEYHGDITLMHQEYPPTEEHAFVMTGSKFFSSEKLTTDIKAIQGLVYETYRYTYGMEALDIDCVPTNFHNAELKIWEHPLPRGTYVLGADPAYGASELSDAFCVQVCRVYADRIVQVAEFRCVSMNTSQFAWVLAHLAGYYRNCMVNLEVTGPGYAVLSELQNMQRRTNEFNQRNDSGARLGDVIGNIRHYLWHRPDSMGGGYSLHWKTNADTKQLMMNTMRSGYENRKIDIKSEECLSEMRYVMQDGGAIESQGRSKDDRVIAIALAVMAWSNWMQWDNTARKETYDQSRARESGELRDESPLSHGIEKYFKRFNNQQKAAGRRR